jgi:hypothetical protein
MIPLAAQLRTLDTASAACVRGVRILEYMHRLQLSEGLFVYVLGLVVIAAQPARFWLGFSLAVAPIAGAVALRTVGSARGRRH